MQHIKVLKDFFDFFSFYPKVTDLVRYRKSVCCLSVVCNVRAPYLEVEALGNISSPFSTSVIL